MKLNTPVDLISQTLHEVSKRQDFTLRVEASEAIKLAQAAMKRYYDKKHLPKSFNVGDEVMLRLHRGYCIPEAQILQLGLQFAGPFKVLKRIGSLAYKLDFPSHLENTSRHINSPFGT
jgi:hypothetical protein